MTRIDDYKITCLRCGQVFSTASYESVNVSMAPRLKDDFLSGKLNTTACPKCNKQYTIGGTTLYHDVQNKIMIYVLLAEQYSNDKNEAIREFTAVLRECLSSSALASNIRDDFEQYHFDIVFSIDELKESLSNIETGIYNEKIATITNDVLLTEEKELPPPEKFIDIRGEKVSLKYFPKLAELLDVDPSLKNEILDTMQKNNADAINTMLVMEKVAKMLDDQIKK